MRQFDVVELRDRSLAVVLQSDLLDEVSSRVLAPLVRMERLASSRPLHPIVRIGRRNLVMLTERMSAVATKDITRVVQSARGDQWEIRRALDLIFVGV